MIDGKVEITPKADGAIDPVEILKATYDSGVSVAEMTIIARGQIVKNSAKGLIFVIDPSKSFPIADNQLSNELQTLADSKTYVTIKGRLYEKQNKDQKHLSFTPLEIQKKE